MGKKLDTPYERIHFVNHSHVDHTWWNPPEVCRERNEQVIDLVVDLCASNPDFKFSYETTAALVDYLEKKSERKEDISNLLKTGRLDIGGLFVSANADACSEETIARNFYFGRRWLESALGYSPKVAKEFDTPGHTLQMPQLVRSAGMDALVISRGPQGGFFWVGPDGSEILTYCVPYNWSYWRKLGISFEETEKNLPAELERGAGKHAGPDLIVPDGDDMTLPNPRLSGIVKRWNEHYDRPTLLLSTFEDFIDRLRSRKFPRRSGDIPNLWVAIHSLQVETTRDMKTLQNLLPSIEALHALVGTQKRDFRKYPSGQIESCWKRALLVADHNWGGKDETRRGDEGDEYKKNLASSALHDCHKLIERAFDGLTKALLNRESSMGMAVLVFNPSAWDRTDIVSIEITCEIPGLEAIEVVNPQNEVVPFHINVLEKHADDTILRASADFLGRGLPSLGYSTYYVKPVVQRKEIEVVSSSEGRTIENEFYRVEFSEDGSCIDSLYDKELDFELAGRFNASAGPFEFEFGMFELFGLGLRLSVPDQSFFENPENEGTGESVEPTGEMWRSSDFPAKIRIEHNGNLSKSLVAEAEFVESQRRQKVVLYDGIKRIDLHVEIDWGGRSNTALYLHIPNTLMSGQNFVDVPFAVHRDGKELSDFWIDETSPVKFKLRGMQDWLCFENEGRGLAVATRWPIVDFTIVPSFLLMWTNDSSGFFFGERYRQVGKHSFSFSLTSYDGTWLENRIHLWGRQWAKPLLTFAGNEAPTEESHSYVSVDRDNIIISAFKKSEDDDALTVRLYEVAGKKTAARLQLSFAIKGARVTNLIETTSKRLASQGNSVKLSFRPFEVKTVKLYL
ncbi:MAG: hypothetical protein JSV16_11465 [Candidatus Hydrogenedentota bacterium]|nr:MAG: hypothetical protein JSV16_11465 [Candidatus Hydrogenedentota bacterium]